MTLILKRNRYGTFANKPSAPSTGQQYFATDLGTGVWIVYTGAKWKPVGGRARIHHTGVAGTFHTGNTNETNVGTVTIPAGLLSANGALEVMTTWGATGTAGTKTTRIKYSATSGGTNGTNIYSIAQGATVLAVHVVKTLLNRNSLSSQVTFASVSASGAGTATAANTTTAINSANESYLNFTVALADGADTCGLDAVTVDWIEN